MNHYTGDQKEEHLKKWSESGLTVADYAKQQDINRRTFSEWARRRRNGNEFVKLKTSAAMAKAGSLVISYKGAVIMATEDSLMAVLQAISRISG